MAKTKIPKLEDLSGYFFMGINGNNVETVYHDNTDNNAAIGAAFSSLLEEDKNFFNIMSAAFMITLEGKEKYSSKKSNKVQIPVKKAAKKK